MLPSRCSKGSQANISHFRIYNVIVQNYSYLISRTMLLNAIKLYLVVVTYHGQLN